MILAVVIAIKWNPSYCIDVQYVDTFGSEENI